MSKAINGRVLQETALRHFLEVIHCGSVTEAAARLGVAPSAVSRQIARLEKELDTLLFERRSRGMVPNAVGELLAVHSRRAWTDVERLTDEIRAMRGLRAGMLRIVSTEGFAVEFLPPLIAEFRQRHASVRFDLAIRTHADITRMVLEGDVDIGISLGLTSERGIKVELRHPSPVMAVLSSDHPLAKQKQLSLKTVAAYPLALPPPNSTLRQLLEVSFSRQGIQAESVFSCDHLAPLVGFAAAGGGIAFCGKEALMTHLKHRQVVAVPLKDREMSERHFEVQTMAGRSVSDACQSFLQDLGSYIKAKP
jgi:DNA-binding transcriptional LysR family regulator